MVERLYAEEQNLLRKLVDSEGKPDKEYQNAIKRTITRLNNDLEALDTP